MDPETQKVTYQRLQSTVMEPSPASSAPNVQSKMIPMIEELQATAQRTNDVPYPLFSRFLPNDIGLAHSGLMSTPLLVSPDGVDPGFEHRYPSRFHADRLYRLKSTESFLFTPFSKKSSDVDSFHRHWPALRQVCLLVLFTCLVGVMCLMIGLLVTSPIAPPCPERHKWFQGAFFYEIFPASFQDTDGDGYGDFQGIIKRLDYIKDLGVKAIRLNSVFCALDYPLEFEHIIDLRNVDPHLGRLADFKDLVKQAHRRGIRVVLDLNPTLTSDQHTWALHWQRGIDGYQHFYASPNRSKAPPEMEDLNGPPPESWELRQRTFGGHYMVNWSNPSVQREYLKTINFWIEMGVDGFYMKHLEHLNVMDNLDIVKVLKQWRQELDRFRLWSSNPDRVLIASVKFVDYVERTMQDSREALDILDLVDVPILFHEDYAQELSKLLDRLWDAPWRQRQNLPWIMWHVGSADSFRFANRIESQFWEAAFYSVFMLPESVSVFYGDEIGMIDSYDDSTGNVYRGGQFAPMQWTSDNQTAGFTDNSSEPWMPLSLSPGNVESDQRGLDRFVRFANVRNVHSWNREYRVVATENRKLFALERPDSDEYQLLLYSSFASLPISRNFSRHFREVNVLASTANFTEILWNAKRFSLNPGGAFAAEVHV